MTGEPDRSGPAGDLQGLREALEQIDHRLLRLLRERMDLVEGVAEAKLGSAWPFRDPAREDRLLLRLRQAAVEEGLDPHEVERLYRVILDMCVGHPQAFERALETTP